MDIKNRDLIFIQGQNFIEKSEKYFYNKECKTYSKKSVSKLNVNGTNVTEAEAILKELKNLINIDD